MHLGTMLQPAVVTGLALVAFAVAYLVYARFLGRRVYGDEEEITTPAHELADGRDYVATNRHVLFGHHFTSVAGAAPIIGPCIALYWGWLPAVLWVVLGTIFMGAVHDFGALVVSAREKGRSVASVAGDLMGGRVRLMFLCLVAVLSWLVLAVFAKAIATLFVSVPSSVIPVNVEIVIAVAIGWLLHVRKAKALVPSLIALFLLYFFVWYGADNRVAFTEVPGEAPDNVVSWLAFGWSNDTAVAVWIGLLLLYSAVASLLPVWTLLQPRDYINSHQLMVGLAMLYAGIFVAGSAGFDAPMLRDDTSGAPSIVPFLFVTIACGAISGFHGLVASGTTSKQLDRLRDARAIGYGSMLGEGSLALAAAMAGAVGCALVGACELPGQGFVPDLSWAVYYDTWANAAANGAKAFVLGGGALLSELGVPASFATTMMAVLVISFAATTLDSATRIERFIFVEIGQTLGLKWLQNRFVATVFALAPAALLVFWWVDTEAGPRRAADLLWPIFGASNQMLAALTLLVLVLYFWRRRRPVLPLLLPMLAIMAITLVALILRLGDFLAAGNHLLAGLSALLLALTLWMAVEGLLVLRRHVGGGEGGAEGPDAPPGNP